MPPKASKRKNATNGYRLPDPIPEGEIFSDGKKKWRIGKSIGVGGFGEIYLCSEDVNSKVGEEATHVMKVEPSENGPLFVEMHFYVRGATEANIEAFKKERGVKDVGIPRFRGKGLHTYKGQSYRFLVIDRFGKDLQKIFQTGKKLFSPRAAYNLSIRCLDALEYIHAQGYVHNDLKAQNLLLGHGRTRENDAYLVDFGLVSKYKVNGVHLEYKPDARRAHDGTIEYTSRDAHIGAHSRRSDLEILGYNLVHWMSGNLPWMSNLTNPAYVHTQKKGFMSDIPSFLRNCFGEENEPPEVIEKFLEYVVGLDFDTKPDYDRCRAMFRSELRRLRLPCDGKIDFSASSKGAVKKRSRKRKISFNDNELELHNNHRKSARSITHPTPSTSPSPAAEMPDSLLPSFAVHTTRSTTAPSSSSSKEGEEWCWERILCSDPEMLIRQASRNSEAEDESPLAMQRRAVEEQRQKESLKNPTPVMLALMKKIEEREHEREQLSWHQQLQHLTGKKGNGKNGVNNWTNLTPNPLTPAMEEVINMRAKRVSIEVDIPITPEPSSDDDSDVDILAEDFGEDSDSSHEEYLPHKRKKPLKKNPSKKGRSNTNIPTVSVQNHISTPNKIRNKGSPIKKQPQTKRRISIQNDAELIHNKESPEYKKKQPVMIRQIKAPVRVSSRLNRKPNSEASSQLLSEIAIEKKNPKISKKKKSPAIPVYDESLPKLSEEDSPQIKWERVLRTNPERQLKKKTQMSKSR